MQVKPKVGLLGLYIELYDNALPEMRTRMEEFKAKIEAELEKRGLEVVKAPVCRVRSEFASAVKSFEDAGAHAIVTLHLAYSPSLESAEVLAATDLPVVVCNTTPTYAYNPQTDPEELLYNHGIHGVQDMCNLLLRMNKACLVHSGHWEKSDVLDQVAASVKECVVVRLLSKSRVGIIGTPFKGMGDFQVPAEVLRDKLGIETVTVEPNTLSVLMPDLDSSEVVMELAEDKERFDCSEVDDGSLKLSVATGIAVRRWVEKEKLSAFTMNFLSCDKASGLPTVPFLEASKLMTKGIGYAGEGDVLTAAMVGALAKTYGQVSFSEMFCPDWENNSVFLSHMGEMNVDLCAEKPVLKRNPFPWTDAEDPVLAVGRFKPGKASLVNIAPQFGDDFSLIVNSGEVLDVDGEDKMKGSVHGWFKPDTDDIAGFLNSYSMFGGTHHLALVYADLQPGFSFDFDSILKMKGM